MIIVTIPLRNYTILFNDKSVCISEAVNYAYQFYIKIMDVVIPHVSHDTF